ncbi:MAG: lamin tail domain-containing protein [Akkermansiaceae bacterium]|nr:lamin tail domain-containing protein [Akkermansiaceae bacterium]
MIRILSLLALGVPVASANILITEVNSNAAAPASSDFFELHNHGSAPVNLNGWRWNDSDGRFSEGKAFGNVTIPAGGVLVVFTSNAGAATYPAESAFRSAWNNLTAPVYYDTNFSIGLGGGDAVILFNASGVVAAHLNYGTANVTAVQGDNSTISIPPLTRINGNTSAGGHAGVSVGGTAQVSAVWSPGSGTTSPRYAAAAVDSLSAFAQSANPGTIGSPGVVGSGTIGNVAPTFSSAPVIYGVEGFDLSNSLHLISASDPNPGQTVTLSVVSKPAWVTVNTGNGSVAGIPPAAGDYEMVVRATDNASPPLSADQTITITVFAESAPVLLNEYSAVAAGEFLGGETSTAVDTYFGRVAGNGGEWFELVVVGNGTANSKVDMRGWKLDVLGDLGTRTLVLSNDAYWSNVTAGTILTFTTSNTAQGGLDTQIHKTSALTSTGVLWSNIWIFDPSFISQQESTVNNRMGISSSNTRFVIRDAAGRVVFGPAGEGIATGGVPPDTVGVNSGEVVKLEADPIPFIDPYYSPYNDGTTSSFGAPNLWGGGGSDQKFTAYRTANSPPRFTSSPLTRAYGSYSHTFTTADPDGNAVTLSATGLPSFLTLTPGAGGTATLSSNRPLTLDDAGFHTVRIVANDGQASNNITPQVFTLTVFHDKPAVILNEYNAVSAGSLLGGPEESSSDTHFGRIAGNGGRWFELAVTGNGGPGTVDLRGWRIEIGSSRGGHPFTAANVITLAAHGDWSAVRAGSLLTFINANTAGGGLDTHILRRDRSSTLGDSWSNVWLGDSARLSVTGATVSGNVVDGIAIGNDDTQFLIRDASGRIVFGPVGEGIAPVSGISATEVFELEGHPSPAVAPFITSDDTSVPPREGYDDGASGSTFGWPNEWHRGTGGPLTLQDFTPYIGGIPASGFSLWISAFPALADKTARGDSDLDGRVNYAEYVFGGNPGVADGPYAQTFASAAGSATWGFVMRDDSSIRYVLKRSANLSVWTLADDLAVSFAPHPDIPGFLRGTVALPPVPAAGKEFFRIELEIPAE